MSHEYWRSLEGRAGTPRTRAFAENEFPEPVEEGLSLDRRTMLLLMGTSLSAAGIAACRRPEEKILPYVNAPENVVPGIPRYYATSMPLRHTAYGLVVESHEGRPTKIEGNPIHSGTAGRSTARIQAAIYDLYDPDRSRFVTTASSEANWETLVSAWQSRHEAHSANGGKGLAVLSPAFSAPTLFRLEQAFRERYPEARFVTWEPAGDENAQDGLRIATGQDREMKLHVDQASVILAIDSDFLVNEDESVRHARGFAEGRQQPKQGMNRLYSVESNLTATGATADHRKRLRASDVEAFLSALANAVGASGKAVAIPGIDARWIAAVAKDLKANGGKSLILGGPHLSPAAHAAILVLNSHLGNIGRTLTLHDPEYGSQASTKDFGELVTAMVAGEVETLVILGGNPVYDAPADLDFAAALAKVDTSIHLGSHSDETGEKTTWHVPEAHFLEAWGDVRTQGGALGVVQPLILPLFKGKSRIELLSLVVSGADRPGYELVRETWKPILGVGDYKQRWSRVLHEGYINGMEAALADVPIDARALAALSTAIDTEGTELVFRRSPALDDGAFANNAWLQELPDPITKLTWDNAALFSPATAASLGLSNGDLARLKLGDREVLSPVFVLPGHADRSVTLTLGYGRKRAGRVGNGVGVDFYPLRTTDSPGFVSGVVIDRIRGEHLLASTQDHGSMEDRPLALESSLAAFRKNEKFVEDRLVKAPTSELWKQHRYEDSPQWGMTIDLNACTGCNACMVACQSENNIPVVGKDQVSRGREMHWIRIDRYFSGDENDPGVVFQPVPCMHCENAPCEQVCPVNATVHDHEGLNTMVYNRCIGTRYCSNNCPYKVRRFNFYNFTKDTPETLKMANNPDVTVRSRGVMEKCTYCTQRINKGKLDAKIAGRKLSDGDILTACQQSCPSKAIEFGDILDEKSAVAANKRNPRNYVLLGELFTKPRTSYLARIRNPNPKLEA